MKESENSISVKTPNGKLCLKNLLTEPPSIGISHLNEDAAKVAVYFTDIELAIHQETSPSPNGKAQKDNDDLRLIDPKETLRMYLKEVGRVPLLTPEEEVGLAKRIKLGRTSREEMVKGNISEERQADLTNKIEDGWAARNHLITANARLVISVAKKYTGRGVSFQSLIQEGNIGLIRAVKKFDYRKGHKFSTHATWWIRQAVTRAIDDQGRTIRVPVYMGEQINRMLRIQHQLTQRLGRDPHIEELSLALDVPSKKVEDMTQAAQRPLSLEAPTDDEEESSLSDFIPATSPGPDEEASRNMLRTEIEEVLKTLLTPREARILQLRYGLLDGHSHTQKEICRKTGLSRESIFQIEKNAKNRIKDSENGIQLEQYLV